MHLDLALFFSRSVSARAFSCRSNAPGSPCREVTTSLCSQKLCSPDDDVATSQEMRLPRRISVLAPHTRRFRCENQLEKTRELFRNPLVPRRLVLIRLQRAAMFRTARSDAIAPSSKLDDWGQQACLRRCKNASIMMLCRATNVARATGRRTFADGPLLKTMLYDLHVCSQRTAKDPSTARAPNRH